MQHAKRETLALNQHIHVLMISRDIKSGEELMNRLNEIEDYSVSKTTLYGYLRGDVNPPRKLIRNLEHALDLDEAERRELADVFAYGD